MKYTILTFLFITTFIASFSAQDELAEKKSAFTVVFGVIADAEAVSTSLDYHSFTTTLAYLRKINSLISLGFETGYFTIYEDNYIPFGVLVDSPLLNKRTSLNLQTSIGYTLSDGKDSNQSGMNWGGVFVKLGLDFNTPVRGENILLKGGFHYRLQERKSNYYDFLSSYYPAKSRMLHLIAIDLGLVFRF